MSKRNLYLGAVIIIGGVILGTIVMFSLLGREKEEPLDDKKITIGYCFDNLVIERWQKDQEIFQAKAKENNVDVIVYNANENNETQNQQIRLLISKKVDVLVIVPYDKLGVSESVNEAKKAGIKVIAYDRLIVNGPIDAYVSFDNRRVGEIQAEALMEVVPSGNYIIINGSKDDNNSYMINQGYKGVLGPSIEKGTINIVAETWAEDWREEHAYDVVAETLERGIQVDGIIGANDRLAEAAIRALSEKGLAGKVPVVGHDADISACQRIVEGIQYMTVYKPIGKLAEAALKTAIALSKEEEVVANSSINNGTGVLPYVKLDVVKVTKENMDETVIAEGFHQRESIYRK